MFIGSLIWLIGVIRWEKKEKPDFDTAALSRVPDLSWEAHELREKLYNLLSGKKPHDVQHHKKRKKKNNKTAKRQK